MTAEQIARLMSERDTLREFARQFAITHDVRPGSNLRRWDLADAQWDALWEAWRDVQFRCLNLDNPRLPVEGGDDD